MPTPHPQRRHRGTRTTRRLGAAAGAAVIGLVGPVGAAAAAPSSPSPDFAVPGISLPGQPPSAGSSVPEEMLPEATPRPAAEAGSVRATWGSFGPHEVASTRDPRPCSSIATVAYEKVVLATQAIPGNLTCYGYFPDGVQSPAGVEYIYPADIASMGKVPLVVLSPGISVEPGMMHEHAEHLASHGYAVALGWSFLNWFGAQMNAAALATALGADDPNHPIGSHVDFSRTALVGHSAGGGSALSMSATMPRLLRDLVPGLQVVSAVAVMPGPSEFGLATPAGTAPTLVTVAEHEILAPRPAARLRYDELAGPGWWVPVRGAYHGTPLGPVSNDPNAGLTLAFLEWTVRGDAAAGRVFAGGAWTLPGDPDFYEVERNVAADAR